MRAGYLLLGLTLAGCSLENTTSRLSNDLPNIAEEYRGAGLPWESAEFTNFEPADVEDATPLIISSYRELQQKDTPPGAQKVDLSQARALAEAGKTREAAKMIAPLDRAFQLALEASNKTAVDKTGDPDKGFMLSGGFSEISDVADLVGVRAEIAAGQGKTAEMLDDLRAGFRLGAFYRQDENAIGIIRQAGVSNKLLRSINFCQMAQAKNVSGLKELEALLESTDTLGSFSEAARGEIYQAVATCRNTMNIQLGIFSAEGSEDNPFRSVNTYDRSPLMRSGLPDQPGQRAEMAMILQAALNAAPAMEKDDVMGVSQAITNSIARETDPLGKKDLALFLQGICGAAGNFLEVQARQEALEALGDALIYRDEHGKWPANLSQLPGRWTDPYIGGPLRMVLRKNGSLRIYSVGPDKQDNGGTARAELPASVFKNGNDAKGYDVVAAYPPAPYQS
jgi:hypothetical protein